MNSLGFCFARLEPGAVPKEGGLILFLEHPLQRKRGTQHQRSDCYDSLWVKLRGVTKITACVRNFRNLGEGFVPQFLSRVLYCVFLLMCVAVKGEN